MKSKISINGQLASDVLDLLKTIANSDERIYRERAKELLKSYYKTKQK